jgi:hypothetical protein
MPPNPQRWAAPLARLTPDAISVVALSPSPTSNETRMIHHPAPLPFSAMAGP